MSDVSLLLDIRGRNVGALRAIAGTKAALRTLSSEQRRQLGLNREIGRVNRDVNRSLDMQSRRLKSLTLDYRGVRGVLLSTAVRGAVAGFSALTSTLGATGAAAVALTSSVGQLGLAVGALGGVALVAGLQGFVVFKGALKGVGKALTTTGTAHEKAMAKLTKPARQLVHELAPLREEIRRLQLISQLGLTPGLTKGVKAGKALINEVEQAVYDTARAMGYLADKGGRKLALNQLAIGHLLEDNVITLRRSGETVMELAETFLHLERGGTRTLDRLSAETLNWARGVKRAAREASANGGLAQFFGELEFSWSKWTSTLGSTSSTVFNVLKAMNPTTRRLADNVADAAKNMKEFTGSREGQSKIQKGFRTLEPVMGEITHTLGDLALTLLRIGDHGAGSAVRILHGFRTQVLPIIEQLADTFDKGLLQVIIGLGRETVKFIKLSLPGIKTLTSVIGFVGHGLVGGLHLVNTMLGNMPPLIRDIASVTALGAVVVGWQRIRRFMAESLLSLRQMIGLAPKITELDASAAAIAGGGRRRGGSAIVTGSGGGRSASIGPGAGFTVAGRDEPLMSVTPRGARPASMLRYIPEYAGPGQTYNRTRYPGHNTPGVYSTNAPQGPIGPQLYRNMPVQTLTSTRVNPLMRQGSNLPVFFNSRGRIAPTLSHDSRLTTGDPVSGRLRGGTAGELRQGRLSKFYNARVLPGVRGTPKELLGGLAGLPMTIAKGTGTGLKTGFMKAVPGVSKVLGAGIGTATFLGLMGAMSQAGTELGRGAKGLAKNFVSSATMGALESTDTRAQRISTDAARAIRDRSRLPIARDVGLGATGAMKPPPLNLNKLTDLDTFRLKYLQVLKDGKKITKDQFTELKAAADQLRNKLAARDKAKAVMGIDLDPTNFKKGIDFVTSTFDTFHKKSKASIGDTRTFIRREMGLIAGSMKKGSVDARIATSAAFGEAVSSIKRNMRSGVISTSKGMAEIAKLHEKNLQLYGFSKAASKNYARGNNVGAFGENERANQTNNHPATPLMAPGDLGTHARGGTIDTIGRRGASGKDNIGVNIVAGSGETAAVFTRHQKKVADRRFADMGGLSGLFNTVRNKHSDPAAGLARYDKGGIVSLGHAIEHRGPYDVSEQSHFGGVHPVHVKGSLHYQDKALDINADGADGGEPKWLDKLASWLGDKGWHYLWRVKDHFDHLHVDTAGGAGSVGPTKMPKIKRVLASGKNMTPLMRSEVQASLDMQRFAANRDLRKRFEQQGGGDVAGETGGNAGDATGMAMMKNIAKDRGWNFADWWSLDGRETGHGANLTNPTSTARLRGQFLSMNYGKYGPGSDPAQHPSMGQQIQSMARYIADRYGTATAAREHEDQYNWYDQGGLVGRAASAPVVGAPVPDVHNDDAITPGSRGNRDARGHKKKPKAKKKPKLQPIYKKNRPSTTNVNRAIQDSKKLIKRGKKGKIKAPKVRNKVSWLQYLLKGGKWFDDPTFTDPITGEPLDVEQMPKFSTLAALRKKNPELETAFSQLTGIQDTTNEFATVPLTGNDLKGYLKKQGFTPDEVAAWLEENGGDDASWEVANPTGMTVDGKWKRGLVDALAELSAQREGRSGILANWMGQQQAASGIDTTGPLGVRRQRLREMRAIFRTNVKVIKKLKAKLKTYGKKRGYKNQIHDNEQIINALGDHLHASSRLPKDYRTGVTDDINELRRMNKELREKKPTVVSLGEQRVNAKLTQRTRENAIISGDSETMAWAPQSMGGLAGVAYDSLQTWRAMDTYRRDALTEAGPGIITDRDINIPAIDRDYSDLSDSIKLPKLKKATATSSADKERINELLIQHQTDALVGLRLELSQFGTLKGFDGLLGQRFLGSFAHGSFGVDQSGIAMIHKNETIVPDPAGAFRTNAVSRAAAGSSGSMMLDVVVRTERGEVLGIVRQEIRQNGQRTVSADTGRKSRARSASPGR